MKHMPPVRVRRIGDPRWHRYVIRDSEGRYWAGGTKWTRKRAGATLFASRIAAIAAQNRCCLDGDAAETFVAKVVMSVHAGRWSAEELVAHLQRHKQFCVGGPAGKGGILLEIVPEETKKVESCGDR